MITKLLPFMLLAVSFFFFVGCQPPKEAENRFDPWILETTKPDTECGTYLGNGYISTRAKAEGMGVDNGKVLPCYMAGFYDDDRIKAIPTWSALQFYASPEMRLEDRFVLDLEAPYRQRLNMRDGTLETRCTLRNGRRRLDTRILLFVSRDDQHTAGLRVSLRSSSSGLVWMAHIADTKIAVRGMAIELLEPGVYRYSQAAQAASTGDSVGVVEALRVNAYGGPLEHSVLSDRGCTWLLRLQKGQEYRIEKLVYAKSFTPKEAPDLGSVEAALMSRLPNVTKFDDKLRKHKAAWHRLWAERDIVIKGDPEAQQSIHSNMFYLLQSARPKGDWSIAPCGLSSDAWRGQIFWDADVWMLPALLPQFPEYAKPMLDYRFKTLAQAERNAEADGYKGASYAWQSAYTGKEMAPDPYRHGRHVTADAAQACWQYYTITGDRKWLQERGYPIVSATAEYWASRAIYNPKERRYEIRQVVGPDELAEIVDNSVYTNAMAQKNLRIAMAASKLLGKSYPKAWKEIAEKLWIPYDPVNDRYVEHEGYADKPTKQADTELLIFPVGLSMSKRTKANTFDFWSAKVKKNNPAMSDSTFAVICCELGRRNQAYSHFSKSYRPFLRGPFNYFNEKESGTYQNMCFLTGCAGPIQSVLYGFAGIRISEKGFDVKPLLPKDWEELEVKGLRFRDGTFNLVVSKGDRWRLVVVGGEGKGD